MKTTTPSAKRARINPFVDWGFKYLFGREENKDLLLGFLNLLLQPDVKIHDIEFLNTELIPDAPDLKRCVVDVLASDSEGNRYLVEMQNAADSFIRQRLVYYACRLVDQMSQHNQNWKYGHIKRVYAVCLMNFNYETEDPVLRSDFQLRSTDGQRTFSDLLTVIPLQIPCVRAASETEYRESYEILLNLLQRLSKGMETREQLLAEVDGFKYISEDTKEMFRKVINTVEADLTPDQWRDYELALDKYQQTIVEYRTALDKGIAQGREEGLKEGREEMRLATARAMKADGVDFSTISKWTGLGAEKIQEL